MKGGFLVVFRGDWGSGGRNVKSNVKLFFVKFYLFFPIILPSPLLQHFFF